jgi:hypothetical protein
MKHGSPATRGLVLALVIAGVCSHQQPHLPLREPSCLRLLLFRCGRYTAAQHPIPGQVQLTCWRCRVAMFS